MEQSRSREANSHSFIQSWNSSPFVEPQRSLPCSKRLTAGSYREPNDFSPHSRTL